MSETVMHYISDTLYWVLDTNGAILREIRPNETYNRTVGRVRQVGAWYQCTTHITDNHHTSVSLEEGMQWVELQLVIKRLEAA